MNRWKQDAFRQMKRARKATMELLSKLSGREITRPETQGEWSIKDVFCHFVAWEEDAVRRLRLIRKGEAAQVHFFQDLEEANRFNARAVSRMRKLTWKQILRRAQDARANLETQLKELAEQELDNPEHRYPVYKWLPEFSWKHEAAHRKRIQKRVSSARTKPLSTRSA